MANGFFLGGAAEGMETAEKQRLARETLATEAGLRERGLGLQERGVGIQERAQTLAEKNAGRAAGQQGLERVDKQIAETMATVAETVKQGLAAGRDPATIQKAVAPLVDSVKRLAPYAKRDPATFDAQVNALLTNPDLIESATAAGTAAGTSEAAKAKALAAGGIDPKAIKDPEKRIAAEGGLRDDYLKQAAPFITVRDFYTNFKQAEASDAGDITRVFSFMKMQDPNSSVQQGEQATAQNAGGAAESVRGMYNKLLGSGSLSPKVREQFANQAKKLFESRGLQHDKLTTTFAGIAKRYGLNTENVVVDLSAPEPKAGSGLKIPDPPPGFVLSK